MIALATLNTTLERALAVARHPDKGRDARLTAYKRTRFAELTPDDFAAVNNARVLDAMPPPPPAEARARIDEVRAMLSRARTLRLAGKFPGGLEQARSALAEALGWPPLTASARQLEGDLLERTGIFRRPRPRALQRTCWRRRCRLERGGQRRCRPRVQHRVPTSSLCRGQGVGGTRGGGALVGR